MQAAKIDAIGVIRLGPWADSYTWKFVTVAGKTSTDSGTTNCH